MAAHQITRGNIAVHEVALVASTADTVTFSDEVGEVEIISDGTANLYVSTDGTPATVKGADCYRLASGGVTSKVLSLAGKSVSLISSGTPAYSVQRYS